MKKKKLLTIFIFIFSISFTGEIFSQMPANLANKPKGKLIGELIYQDLEGNQSVASNKKVALMVFFQGQRVLMIDKDTNEKGIFEFNNIFKDPDYQYAVGAIVDDKLYVYPNISMKEDKEELRIKFQIGENSPYKISEEITSQAKKIALGEKNQSFQQNSEPQIQPTVLLSRSQAKNLTIILSILVVILAGFYSVSKKHS